MSKVPAATQTMSILKYLATQPGPVPAARISAALQIPRSTTYHLLTVMMEQGFVDHSPEEQAYSLGVSAFEIGSSYLRRSKLERLARPLLTTFVAKSGMPIVGHLGILHGREILYLLKESAPDAPFLITAVDVRLPAHLTATGRAILAHLPAAQLRALFPESGAFVQRCGTGPGSLSELRQVLGTERRRGWASEDGEVTTGYASVAVAALDHTGWPAASIGATFRAELLDAVDRRTLAERCRTTVDRLTGRLHGRV